MTVLEYDCLQNQYPNPMTPSAQGINEFKLRVFEEKIPVSCPIVSLLTVKFSYVF